MKFNAWYVFVLLLVMAGTAYGQQQQQQQQPPDTTLQANVARVTGGGAGNEATPRPDPTRLTTEAVDRLKEVILELFGAKFEAMQKQIDRNQLRLDQSEASVKAAIEQSERLTSEKFKGLSDQQVQRDNNLALALTTQQKSVADQNLSNLTAAEKAEKNFKEQIAGIQILLAAQEKTSSDKLTDIKDRLATSESTIATRLQAIESRGEGAGSAINWIVLGVGFLLTMIGIISGIMAMVSSRHPPPQVPVVIENGNSRMRK